MLIFCFERGISLKDFHINGFLGEEIHTYIEDNTKYYEKYFSFCEELNRYSYTIIYNNDFSNNARESVSMSLFIKILNAFQGAVILYKYGLDVEAQTVARPALESLFVLAAINEEEGFYDNFVKLTDVEREIILSKIKKYPECYPNCQDIPELEELEELIEKNKETTNYRKSKIAKFAKFAKMEFQYNTAYSFFSSAIHPNLGNLRSSYWIDDGERIKELRYTPYTKNISYTLRVLCATLIEGMACLDDCFTLNLTEDLKLKAEKLIEVFKEE